MQVTYAIYYLIVGVLLAEAALYAVRKSEKDVTYNRLAYVITAVAWPVILVLAILVILVRAVRG